MTQIKVKCSHCKHEFWMSEFDKTQCPSCGTVAIGPKA